MRELALFAGAGGGILGGTLLGWQTVCAVELDSYAASVLCARQNDGVLPPFPVWDDISAFDGRPWRGIVDVVSGGFPCQDISAAGPGAGLNGERSGLWREMARVVREVGPRYVFVENSPMLTLRGLDRVLGELASLGYDAEWCVLGAVHAGAPHKRERIWIVAHSMYGGQRKHVQSQRECWSGDTSNAGSDGASRSVADTSQHGRFTRRESDSAEEPQRREPDRGGAERDLPHSDAERLEKRYGGGPRRAQPAAFECDWWSTEPDVC